MKYIKCIFIVSIIISSCADNNEESKLQSAIIPQPAQLKVAEGAFKVSPNTGLVFDKQAKEAAMVIKDYLASITGYELPEGNESMDNSIQFRIDSALVNKYELRSNDNQIIISAGSRVGLLYGFQSLRQLLLMNDGNQIPALEIVDEPAFEWRGFLLDCSRHFMEKDFVKRYIDLLALYKMNVLHWHLTEDQGWRIEIDKYPKLTEVGAWRDDGKGGKYGGFYTKEDIQEIVAYASERGVRVVPEIELPGHSQAALAAYPQFSCTGGPFEVETEWGVFKEIYCAGNDSTFIFLEDVLTEVIELFPSEYIHIGGDEVPKFRWEQCAKCQRRIQEEDLHDEHELQSYFISRIGKFLESKGKKMIGWDEILEGGLPEGAIVQSWRGFEGAVQAVESGHQAILSPTSHSYFDYGLNDIDMEKVYGFDPVPGEISGEQRGLILGGECNMWSERAPQSKVDSKVFPRMLAMSEVLWSYPEDRDFDAFRERAGANYKVLDQLGVTYGFETVPVKVISGVENGKLQVSLKTYDTSIQAFYSQDGVSNEYSNPVTIEAPTRWAITFGRGEAMFKDTIYQHFDPHMAIGLSPELATEYNASYTAGGDSALANGLKGSNQFRDGNWQGYWGHDVIATLDLGEEKDINQLSAGFLQYNNAWIFFPEEVRYEFSLDGESFEWAGTVENKISHKEKAQQTEDFTVNLKEPVRARYVRLHAKNIGKCPEWHDAAGSRAWLFVDEFSVN